MSTTVVRNGIGESQRRMEDFRFLTGKGNYIDDMNLPNQAYAMVLRSPEAHADIKSIDASEALALDGVLAVITGEEWKAAGYGPIPTKSGVRKFKDGSDLKEPPHHPIAIDRVRYVGQPVALIVAENLDICRDALELMDHLRVARVTILGTSRGGLNAMGMALAAPGRLLGVCFNDIGPELDPKGLTTIMGYLGRRPAAKTHEDAASALEKVLAGFEGVPRERWLEEARKHFVARGDGLDITYDPDLRRAVEEAGHAPDLWPFFDALAGKPVCLIRGAGSDLMSAATADRMQARRPDMIRADVPGRGHVPYLDEPQAVAALREWIGQLQ